MLTDEELAKAAKKYSLEGLSVAVSGFHQSDVTIGGGS
jgi:hypothetical protein